MNHSPRRSLLPTCLVALSVVVTGAQAMPARAAVLGGTVETLSPASKNLTIKSDTGRQVTLKVTRATVIRRNAAAAQLFNLAPGDRIIANFNAANENAGRLSASGPKLRTARGQVMDKDGQHHQLRIATGGGARIFTVSSATRVVRNNRVARFSAITLRDAVTVHSVSGNVDDGQVNDVEADGPEEDGVSGTIASISGTDVTITQGEGGADVTFHTDGTTQITIDGAPATLADLKVGVEVQVAFDPVSMVAFSIEVDDSGQHHEQDGQF